MTASGRTATAGVRLRAAVGLAAAQLRHNRVQTLLAVAGVALAVLAVVVLASLGAGVLDRGTAGFESTNGDLWATAGTTTFAPGAVGSVDNGLRDAHAVARELRGHDAVTHANAVAFQTVYIGREPGDYETIVAVGASGSGGYFTPSEGRTFTGSDVHYADGGFDGPMTREVLLDSQAAALLGVTVGDEVHLGGTIVAADEHTFTVVGISDDVGRYIGAPTVLVPLSELQTVSGTTGTDPATAVIIAVEDDADPATVRDELAARHPELTVRTNREQFAAMLGERTLVLAAGGTLVVLAVGGGIALVANVFGLLVYRQRRQLAALKAAGVAGRTLLLVVLVEGIAVAITGTLLGIAALLPAVRLVNAAVVHVVGLEDLVAVVPWALAVGGGLAVVIGLLGAAVAGWRISRVTPTTHLPR